MRINNFHLRGLSLEPVPTPQSTEDTGAPAATPRTVAGEDSMTLSPELTKWLSLVRQDPEVRPELLAEVSQKLLSGYYLSPEVAWRTAEAILRARD